MKHVQVSAWGKTTDIIFGNAASTDYDATALKAKITESTAAGRPCIVMGWALRNQLASIPEKGVDHCWATNSCVFANNVLKRSATNAEAAPTSTELISMSVNLCGSYATYANLELN